MMKVFSVVLVVAAVLGLCGATPVVRGAEGTCLGAGYNIVTQQCSFNPLFQYTYSRGRAWLNPYTMQEETWPDQLSVIDMDHAQVDSQQYDVQSWNEYVSILDKSLSISVGISYDGLRLGLAFTHSKGTYNLYSKSSSAYFAQQTRKVTLYKAMLLRSIYSPSQDFVDAYSSLKPGCTEKLCLAQYCHMVNTYGTHFVNSVVMGGYQNVTATYSKSITTTESKEWVANQIDLTLSFLKYQVGQLGVGIGRNVSRSQINSKFLKDAHLTSNTFGGDLSMGHNFTLWLPTVPHEAVSILPYDGEVLPLYEAFEPATPDVVSIISTMRNVIIHYIETGGQCPTSAVDYPMTVNAD